MWSISVTFKILTEVNNYPMSENSPNPVTLDHTQEPNQGPRKLVRKAKRSTRMLLELTGMRLNPSGDQCCIKLLFFADFHHFFGEKIGS
jgi:hypothetical protein